MSARPSSLASALRAIPARDTLLLAGDFNAQLHTSSTPRQNTGVRDESFQRFVESHRLVALNTWSSGRGHTYVQGDARTQIDYIFTFPNSSRGQAKQAKPAPQLGLGGWKKGGHIPNSGAQVMTPSASFETQTEVRENSFHLADW